MCNCKCSCEAVKPPKFIQLISYGEYGKLAALGEDGTVWYRHNNIENLAPNRARFYAKWRRMN